LAVPDLAANPDWHAQPLVHSESYQSGLLAPLAVDSNTVGLAAFLSTAPRDFSADLNIAQAVAGQMAFVAQNGALAAQRQTLAVRAAELDALQHNLATQSSELEARGQVLASQAADLAAQNQVLAAERAEFELKNQALQGRIAELATQRETLATQQRDLTKQGTASRSQTATVTSARETAPDETTKTLTPAEDQMVMAEALAETAPTIVTPPQYDESDATLITSRKRVPEPLAEFDVTAADLVEVPDADPVDQAPPLNLWLVGGLITVFIVGGLAITLALTGGFGRFLGGGQPTTVAVIVTNTAAPTVEASVTVAVSPTVAFTATSAPTLAPTDTPAPTETATEVPTDTPVPTAGPTLPPGVVAYGTIRVAEGTSARLRASPNGDVVGSVPNNAEVQVLQGREVNGGVNWIQIRLNSGQVGWIAENLVETSATP
jgi:hypothetical protein